MLNYITIKKHQFFLIALFYTICIINAYAININPANMSIDTIKMSYIQMYEKSKEAIREKNLLKAESLIKKIIEIHPFGIIYQECLINLIYIKWKNGEECEALTKIEDFQRKYPNHPRSDYILYLKALINFDPQKTILFKLTNQEIFKKDVNRMRVSYKCYEELINNFPNSVYTKEAHKLIRETVDSIANSELSIARYYYKNGAYIAAINRAKNVIKEFEDSKYKQESLEIIKKSCKKIEMLKKKTENSNPVINQQNN